MTGTVTNRFRGVAIGIEVSGLPGSIILALEIWAVLEIVDSAVPSANRVV